MKDTTQTMQEIINRQAQEIKALKENSINQTLVNAVKDLAKYVTYLKEQNESKVTG